MALLNVRQCKSFPVKNFIGWNPQKFNPANISMFKVLVAHEYNLYIYNMFFGVHILFP